MVISICTKCKIAFLIHFHFSPDAIIARFGMKEYNDTAAKVRTQANQKCSDLLTKKKKKTD